MITHEQTIEMLDRIEAALRGHALRAPDEAMLAAGVQCCLELADIPSVPELRLGEHGRVDFWVPVVEGRGGIAVELKTRAPFIEVMRQLGRYAKHDAVLGLVLVTTKMLAWPQEVAGTPLRTVSLALERL